MKREMRRLFAFLLALMLFMPAGIPAEAGTARADTETKADLLPQVSIVSSEPDANGVYTMDFSVKQDELLYADRIVNKAVFVFTYDTDSIVPVNAVDGTDIDGISDKDTTTTSPFVLASGDFKISKVAWLVDETNRRTTVGVIAETTNTDGLAMTQPAKMFSFSYRVKTATPKQGMLKIESDPSVLQRFFESYDITDYAQQAGILISHVKSG